MMLASISWSLFWPHSVLINQAHFFFKATAVLSPVLVCRSKSQKLNKWRLKPFRM